MLITLFTLDSFFTGHLSNVIAMSDQERYFITSAKNTHKDGYINNFNDFHQVESLFPIYRQFWTRGSMI